MSSKAVKEWRKNTKQRIVDAFGGYCCVCGYDRCNESLALHHLDPTKKDFNFGAVRANPKSWKKIVAELRKCVLICHNCHNEVHYGVSIVPENALRFDESFADYKAAMARIKQEERRKLFTPCLYCGKDKPHCQRYCSAVCSGKARVRVDWESIDLVEELKTKSNCQLGRELNVSEATIRKRLKKAVAEQSN